MPSETRFRAMGSDCHVVVVGGPAGLAATAEAHVDRLESRWSRLRPDSDVTRMTRAAGAPVEVSPDTVLLVRRSIEAWRLSAGAFDPTVLGALVREGYDRTFEALGGCGDGGPAGAAAEGAADGPPAGSPEGSRPGRRIGQPGVEAIELTDRTVTLPAGVGFDPGGIGKGLAADLVVEALLAAGADGACVNLGGDVRASGDAPGGGAWTVAVEHPASAVPLSLVGLRDGAVATSSTLRRRWVAGGGIRHHVIDPHTGRSADTDVELASVVAGRGWVAEVLATAVLLAGAAHPFDTLGRTGAASLAVDTAGRLQRSDGWLAYTAGVEPLAPDAVGFGAIPPGIPSLL